MRIQALTCWLLVLGLSVSCSDGSATRAADVSSDKHFETVDLGDGRSLPYAYHLPHDFDPAQEYPVLIGPGDGTPGSNDSFYWKKGDPSEHGWIIVESMAFLEREPVETTQKLLDHLSEKFKVEGGKFHIMGFSANSVGCFHVALAMPDRFHSATGVPGYPRSENLEALAPRLKDLKFQFLVGERDTGWLRPAERAHEQLQALGLDSRLEVIPDAGHVITEIIGREFMKRMDWVRPGRDR